MDTPAGEPRIALIRIYEFKGKGRQPELNHDATKKVEWVEAGSKERSTVGDSLRGGSSMSETYAEGRVGLANGAILKVKPMYLIYGMGDELESVEGS
jgi:hypothetical protein